MKKPSFLERLTGSAGPGRYEEDDFDADGSFGDEVVEDAPKEHAPGLQEGSADDTPEGELPIDMYFTPDAIVIRALVAGVNPADLDVSITRDMVTLKGRREEVQEVPDENYYHRELFWGSFSRTVLLPDEVLIDEAEAREKHGMLEIILPRVDKERATKLSVKSQGK